jgi:uncharacterized membrane protein YeaQ/YmgE (transglycosylase-associated protein family)
MSILAFILLGLIAGWLASIIMGTDEAQGPLMDIVLGIVGAFLGAFIFSLFGASGATGLNLYSIVIATVGAIALISIGRALGSRI